LSAARLLKYLQVTYFSKAPAERDIFRTIRKLQPSRILEIGVGDGQLAKRMIELASQYAAEKPIRYTGIDLFEGRAAQLRGLPLIVTHRLLVHTGARVQLVPGDPFTVLATRANSLVGIDLLVVRADQDAESMERAWFYVPRMLHANSLVFVERTVDGDRGSEFVTLDHPSIERLAATHDPRRQRRWAA
jgi:hypothetical protein